eukprot:scaffold41842_cov36-Phaeocystis_antarctica.AAC.1
MEARRGTLTLILALTLARTLTLAPTLNLALRLYLPRRGAAPWRTCAAFTLLPSYHPSQARRGGLEDVCAWLVINSMRTERVQFEVWALILPLALALHPSPNLEP